MPFSPLVGFSETSYYVDANSGIDTSSGSQESPFKTLTYAISRSENTTALIYLRKAQTFSDLTSMIEVDSNLTIK